MHLFEDVFPLKLHKNLQWRCRSVTVLDANAEVGQFSLMLGVRFRRLEVRAVQSRQLKGWNVASAELGWIILGALKQKTQASLSINEGRFWGMCSRKEPISGLCWTKFHSYTARDDADEGTVVKLSSIVSAGIFFFLLNMPKIFLFQYID